jgi:hypothetical protein
MPAFGNAGATPAGDGLAAPADTGYTLQQYRADYKDSGIPVKYILVDEKGQECCTGRRSKKVFVLDITRYGEPEKIFSSEITKLAAAHFEVEVDLALLLETSAGDFVVLKMSRPSEYNKKAVACAAGKGEDRAYLATIQGRKNGEAI